MMCGANDLKFLDMCFTGRDSGLGDISLRNKQNMDSEDVAVFKHSFHTWGLCYLSLAKTIDVNDHNEYFIYMDRYICLFAFMAKTVILLAKN